MIKGSILNKVIEAINNHPKFEISDFEMKNNGNSSISTLAIQYLGEEKFFMTITIDGQKSEIYGQMSPGEIASLQKYKVTYEESIYPTVGTWLNYLWEELISNPVVRQHEAKQKELEEIFKKYSFNSEEYFSKSEADELRIKLDTLERNLAEELEKISRDVNELKAQKKALHQDIENLKLSIPALKKGYWSKTMLSKMMKWVGREENRSLLEGGFDMMKGLLGEPS